jgi:hypothetical protein
MLAATIWAMRRGPGAGGDAIDRAWMRLGERLARAGIARHTGEGPLDWLARAHRTAPALAQRLDPLVGEYVELRYAADSVAPDRISAFARAVRRLRVPRMK